MDLWKHWNSKGKAQDRGICDLVEELKIEYGHVTSSSLSEGNERLERKLRFAAQRVFDRFIDRLEINRIPYVVDQIPEVTSEYLALVEKVRPVIEAEKSKSTINAILFLGSIDMLITLVKCLSDYSSLGDIPKPTTILEYFLIDTALCSIFLPYFDSSFHDRASTQLLPKLLKREYSVEIGRMFHRLIEGYKSANV